jgi:heme exporter protein D
MEFTIFITLLVVGPMAIYFLVLGAMHLSGRIIVVSGGRDFAALALATAGLIAAGPVELFFPATAMTHFGLYIWLALAMLFLLSVLLIILNQRPQYVVYGANLTMLAEAVREAAKCQDEAATCQGEFIDLPSTGLMLRIDGSATGTACRITAISSRVYLRQWLQLRSDLQRQLQTKKSVGAVTGVAFLCASLLMLAGMLSTIVASPQAVATGFQQWLNH